MSKFCTLIHTVRQPSFWEWSSLLRLKLSNFDISVQKLEVFLTSILQDQFWGATDYDWNLEYRNTVCHAYQYDNIRYFKQPLFRKDCDRLWSSSDKLAKHFNEVYCQQLPTHINLQEHHWCIRLRELESSLTNSHQCRLGSDNLQMTSGWQWWFIGNVFAE